LDNVGCRCELTNPKRESKKKKHKHNSIIQS
jgi:hypothetical protein